MGDGGPGASTGLLVMAYGTPATPADVEAYYTHIRRGRAPTPELLAELQGRYEAIGGVSPLLERTQAQAAGIAQVLGGAWTVELGMKHASPFIEDGGRAVATTGVDRVVGLVLAPHYSSMSVGQYEARAREVIAEAGLPFTMVRSWHLEPAYVSLLAERVRVTCARQAVDAVHVIFTAHSLPERVVAAGETYRDQLRETAEAVAHEAGLNGSRWSVAWQSAGRTADPWIGPDILEVLPELASGGVGGVVVCPCGFVSDHLEILYDLDVEAAGAARELGVAFDRTAMPNADPAFCSMLADTARRSGSEGG